MDSSNLIGFAQFSAKKVENISTFFNFARNTTIENGPIFEFRINFFKWKSGSEIAKTQPQAALSAYIHGEQHRFTYFLRTIEGIEDYLMPLDDIITHTFIPAILGTTISDTERELFALPIINGGLGMQRLTEKAANEYEISRTITAPLVAIMAIQDDMLPDNKNHIATKAKYYNKSNNI